MPIEVDFNQVPLLIWRDEIPYPVKPGDHFEVLDHEWTLRAEVVVLSVDDELVQAEPVPGTILDI